MTQTQLSYKEREKQRREHEIVLEARRLIRESGAASFNMDTLADAVGVSKPTLYQHFKSKEDLLVRVIVEVISEMGDYLASFDEASPLERLKKAMHMILVQRYSIDGLGTDFETELLFSNLHTRPEVGVAKARTLALTNQVIDEGKARGEIITHIPTTLLGCMFFRLIGLPATFKMLLFSDAQQQGSESITPVFDHIIDLFVRSIALEPPTI